MVVRSKQPVSTIVPPSIMSNRTYEEEKMRYPPFKSCLLKHECKSGKLDGDKMGDISKIGLGLVSTKGAEKSERLLLTFFTQPSSHTK